jgi:hypothetical protein
MIIAVLEQCDSVCKIRLERFTRSQPEKLVPLMQESFLALTNFTSFRTGGTNEQQYPDDSFLGVVPHVYDSSVWIQFPS